MSWPRLSQTLALLAAGLGAFCFSGWVLEIETLKRLHSGWVTMKANTAVCLMLTGIAVALLREEHGPPWKRRLAQACAVSVITVGAVTLAEHLGTWDFGMDQLLLRKSLEFPLINAAAAEHAPLPAQGPDSCALRILLVEDHKDTRRVLHRLITGWGHTVTAADSVAPARLAIAEGSFDCRAQRFGTARWHRPRRGRRAA